MRIPRFQPNISKTLEALLWLANACNGIDVYHLVKASFFADKQHIAKYGRPICGDNYDAAPYGPLSQVLCRLLRRDPIEMLAIGGNGDLPFDVDRQNRVYAHREANLRRLSSSDTAALSYGLDHVKGRTFDDIFNETHEDDAYLNAYAGKMDYRYFISYQDPIKGRKILDIAQNSECAAI